MILDLLKKAAEEGQILETAMRNAIELLETKPTPGWVPASIEELVESENWEEINDRFHKHLEFGTGGMRGRTIGRTITKSEQGKSQDGETPEFAAVGSNTLNELTLLRATKALFIYTEKWLAEANEFEQPRLVVAHDVRHFSPQFSKLVAGAWTRLGGYAMTFDGPRSTPQLSFAIRHRYAHAGVVITASHNPFHDNGFKAYFGDGAQLVAPHDKGVAKVYQELTFAEVASWLNDEELGQGVRVLSTSDDMAYKGALEDAVINPALLKEHAPKLVFTPIHGTGAISSVPALWDHGVNVLLVDEQGNPDPNFSTVKSPNPENPEALALGIKVAKKAKADYVLGSDPDCDRIGLAVRDSGSGFSCLSGNQVACMIAEYRLQALRSRQIIRDGNEANFAILKTFVTTPLITRIAESYGVRCVNTPTGFKWMAQKLGEYERTASMRIKETEGIGLDYDGTEVFARMDILSRYSTCVVLAAEESYGYLPMDLVRDKDGNASALAISELLAHLNSKSMTVMDYLDEIYSKHGYHLEKTENVYFEGAEGSATIERLTQSYRREPLTEIAGIKVVRTKDFSEKGFVDEEDSPLPTMNFIQVTLENNYTLSIRPSGTEPKIKYYLFGCEDPVPEKLQESKKSVSEQLSSIGSVLLEDAQKRARTRA